MTQPSCAGLLSLPDWRTATAPALWGYQFTGSMQGAVTSHLLNGLDPLIRFLGMDGTDTYITRHEIDDLFTVVHIDKEANHESVLHILSEPRANLALKELTPERVPVAGQRRHQSYRRRQQVEAQRHDFLCGQQRRGNLDRQKRD